MPTCAVAPTVTIPVTESMVIPVIVGEIVNRHGPVPFVRANADELTVLPNVEVTFEPPVIPTGAFTSTVSAAIPIAPT